MNNMRHLRQFIVCLLITTLLFPWQAMAQFSSSSSTDPMSASHPAFAQLKAAIPNKITVPAQPDADGNITGTTTQSVDYLGYVQSKGNLVKGCNPVVWAAMLSGAQQRAIIKTANAIGMNNQTAQAMNNQCVRTAPDGSDLSAVNGAIIAQKEAELHAIESAICSLNFSSLLSGLLGLNLSICKGGNLIGGGITDTLSKTFLAKANDIKKNANCIQAQNMNKSTLDNASGPYALDALAGGIGVAKNEGLTTGGSGGFTIGFGTNVNAGISASTNNGISTTTSTTTTTGNSAPIATSTPSAPTSTATVTAPQKPVSGTSTATPLNIYK